jgi:hypothetical protein
VRNARYFPYQLDKFTPLKFLPGNPSGSPKGARGLSPREARRRNAMDQLLKLTIYAAGSLESLARTLALLGGLVHLAKGENYWEAGGDLVLFEKAMKVEAYIGPEWLPEAVERIEEWHRENGQPTIVVEIARAFARILDGDTD